MMVRSGEAVASPIKWRKYLLLTSYGFMTFQELEREVVRYPWARRLLVFRVIARQIRQSSGRRLKYLYVVKIVPSHLDFQLPNCIVRSVVDLSRLQRCLCATYGFAAQEVWFCRTRIEFDILSVAGRMLFYRHNGGGQVVEQVWRCSPRAIERYSPNFPWPYARARRLHWGWRYDVEHVRVPGGSGMSRGRLAARV
jgi:hypothetical protein